MGNGEYHNVGQTNVINVMMVGGKGCHILVKGCKSGL